MPTWPTAAECEALFSQLGLHALVVEHVRAVERLAVPLAGLLRRRGHPVDMGLVRAGALLHDLGRSRTQGLDHAGVGASLLRERGFPEPLCLVVERHTGGGIDPGEAAALGLPIKDYTPRTLEEKIVCQTDNLVDGSRRQRLEEELTYLRARGLGRVATKIAALHRELSALLGKDLDGLR